MSDSIIIDNFTRYTMNEFHKLPENPGIYCWYSKTNIAEIDWKETSDKDFYEIISSFLKRYRPNSLQANVKSSFGLSWESDLTERNIGSWVEAVEDKLVNDNASEPSGFNSMISKDNNRELLSRVLNLSGPIFSSPLYIGKANNLSVRLNEHKNKLNDLYEEGSKEKDRFFNNGSDFSERAFGAGFTRTELYVYALDLVKFSEQLKITNYNVDDLYNLSLTLEYILNRKYRPFLGRN
ncbi:hypothetical protein [Vibrio sp. 10N.247.311.49]|uniref:hypothetical protein n=1 Tax=Vibrio sp. 10N.247.311.49 TaxID=3229993 RepID=UPI00354FC7C1